MSQRQPISQPAMQTAAKPGMQSNVQPEVQQKEEGSPDPYLPTKGQFAGTPFAKFSPRYYINKYGGMPMAKVGGGIGYTTATQAKNY